MSFQKIYEYINYKLKNSSTPKHEIAKEYGTENFSLFLYSLIKMTKPRVMLELGTGAGITTFLAAQAMKENGTGRVYTVDNATQWSDTKMYISEYFKSAEIDYARFIEVALKTFEIEEQVRYFNFDVAVNQFFMPDGIEKLDVLYVDCLGTNITNVTKSLNYYLPRMNTFSSIFWDNASTVNHTFLLFENMVKELNAGKIPIFLRSGLKTKEMGALEFIVRTCKFTLVHLTDDFRDKVNKHQNSRTWLKIEQNDFIPHGAHGGGVNSFIN